MTFTNYKNICKLCKKDNMTSTNYKNINKASKKDNKDKPKKVKIDPISKWQPIKSYPEKFVLFDKKWRNGNY